MFSVVIPTLNEGKNLRVLLPKVKKLCDEILIVDDGSKDETIEVAKKHKCTIYQRDKVGVGSAIVEGAKMAKGDIVAIFDGDMSHPPEILKGVKIIENDLADIVKCSRFIHGGGMSYKTRMPLLRLYNRLMSFLSGIKLHDFTGGLLIAKRDTFNYESIAVHGEWIIEYLINNKRKRFSEIPYIYGLREHGESKFSGVKDFRRLVRYLGFVAYFRRKLRNA